jgi:hypothetical protein
MIEIDWSAHIPDTLADLQQAACEGNVKLAVDISAEARRVGATESDIKEAIASGRQMAEPRLKLIASCEGDADGAVLDMLIAHGCPAREDVLATLREGEHTNIEGHEYNGLVVKRVPGGWHLLREDVDC